MNDNNYTIIWPSKIHAWMSVLPGFLAQAEAILGISKARD